MRRRRVAIDRDKIRGPDIHVVLQGSAAQGPVHSGFGFGFREVDHVAFAHRLEDMQVLGSFHDLNRFFSSRLSLAASSSPSLAVKALDPKEREGVSFHLSPEAHYRSFDLISLIHIKIESV